MGIVRRTQYVVYCENMGSGAPGCEAGFGLGDPFEDRQEFIDFITADGWVKVGRKSWLCPDCSKRRQGGGEQR